MLALESLARAHNAHQPGFPYWMLTLNYGVGQLKAALAWGESALATLEATQEPRAASAAELALTQETDLAAKPLQEDESKEPRNVE